MNSTTLLPRSEGVVFFVVAIVESLVIIIGNAIVVAAFTRNRLLRKRKFYLLINLAIADSLVGATAVPLWVSNLPRVFNLWEYKGNFRIYFTVEGINVIVCYDSLVNLMMVSLERMYATFWPLKHRVLETRTYYVLIGLCWTLVIFPFSFRLARNYKVISSSTSLYIWSTFTCLILLTICISYVSIWIKIKFGRHPQHHVTTAQDRKLTVSLFIVTAVSLVTWLPFVIISQVIPIQYSNGISMSFIRANHYTSLLFFANSLVNPIIYSFRMPQFRQAALRLVCRRSAERRVPAIEMRNEAEVINHQACAVISWHPESNMAANNSDFKRDNSC